MSIDARPATTEGHCIDCGATGEPMIDEYNRLHERQPGDWYSVVYRWDGPYCENRLRCWARLDRAERGSARGVSL